MDEKKPSPIWVRVLLFLGCCSLALILWAFAIGPLYLYLLLPLFRKLCIGEIALGIWLLLALLTGLLVWQILLFRRGKHRLLAFFGAVYVLFCAFQATPFLDLRVHSPKPELAASFYMEDARENGPEFYYSGWPYGGSTRTEPGENLPTAAREKLTELLRDQSRTWIVSCGEQLESITWSYQDVWYYNTMIPWMIGLQCDWDWTKTPGDPDVLYIYSIPFAPIDDIY